MTQFEIGKTYATTSICNSDCIISITVLARTAATITVKLRDEIKRLRISKKYSEYRNAETVLPWGSYSMAPMISADSDEALLYEDDQDEEEQKEVPSYF